MTKVSELTGRKLDEWVARAEGHHVAKYQSDGGPDILAVTSKDDGRTRIIDGGTAFEWLRSGCYHPSTDPAQGHMIIEREKIGLDYNVKTGYPMREQWFATVFVDQCNVFGEGDTALIAAMRARVAMVYGDEVPA